MHNKWEVFRGDSTKASDLLFTVKRPTLMRLKTEMDVFLAGNTAQPQACDFKMKCSSLDKNCAFYLGNSDVMIAHVSMTDRVQKLKMNFALVLLIVIMHACFGRLASVWRHSNIQSIRRRLVLFAVAADEP